MGSFDTQKNVKEENIIKAGQQKSSTRLYPVSRDLSAIWGSFDTQKNVKEDKIIKAGQLKSTLLYPVSLLFR